MPVDAPIAFTSILDSVHRWLKDSTGLERVIWRDQSAPQPIYPFASLKLISGPTQAAPQAARKYNYISGNPNGEQLEIESYVPVTFVVSAHVVVSLPDSRDPDVDAASYLHRALIALSMETFQSYFRAVNVSYIRAGSVMILDEVVEDAYVSRRGLDVTFLAFMTAQEYITYIQKVHVTSDITGASSGLQIDETIGDV